MVRVAHAGAAACTGPARAARMGCWRRCTQPHAAACGRACGRVRGRVRARARVWPRARSLLRRRHDIAERLRRDGRGRSSRGGDRRVRRCAVGGGRGFGRLRRRCIGSARHPGRPAVQRWRAGAARAQHACKSGGGWRWDRAGSWSIAGTAQLTPRLAPRRRGRIIAGSRRCAGARSGPGPTRTHSPGRRLIDEAAIVGVRAVCISRRRASCLRIEPRA